MGMKLQNHLFLHMQVRPGGFLKTCLKKQTNKQKKREVNSYHVLEAQSPPCLGFKAKKTKNGGR